MIAGQKYLLRSKYIGVAAPSKPVVGDTWRKTTDDNLYIWDGNVWVQEEIQDEAANKDAYDRAMRGI